MSILNHSFTLKWKHLFCKKKFKKIDTFLNLKNGFYKYGCSTVSISHCYNNTDTLVCATKMLNIFFPRFFPTDPQT